MAKVNLDALIPREDFEATESVNSGKKKEAISIEDIKSDSFFLSAVRKPDFQRETNEWDAETIVQYIESFVNGDLIPALILWRSPNGYIFIIDGAHRLSSLVAWINDDYGDGKISKMFYDGIITEEQNEIADSARKIVRKRIGTYDDFKLALSNPDKVKPEIVKNAKNLAALAIQLQWVEGDVKKAETSFFKINQQAAPIDPTELKLLESRKKPNCIAARAIIRAGKGHKYWSKFNEPNQKRIQELAQEINSILFSPKLETPIKTLDIPIGGKQYSAQTLPLILEFINLVNDVPNDFKDSLSDDNDGTETISFLTQARKTAYRINSIHASSLGLHPIIYFYSQDGRYKIASFYGTISFILDLEKKNKFNDFIKVRASFEIFLLENEYIVQQINRRFRSALGAHTHIALLYNLIVDFLNKNIPSNQILDEITRNTHFNYLTLQKDENIITSNEFNKNRKSAVFIKEAVESAIKCKICGGYIHRNSITIDHKERKQDGGLGSIDNAQLAHPYCNTTYKN